MPVGKHTDPAMKAAILTKIRLAARDRAAIDRLRAAHDQHPFYGVYRLSLHLGWSQHRTRRIRNLAGIVIPTASKKHRHQGGKAQIPAPPNILHRYAKFKDESRPQDGMDYSAMVEAHAWVQDFTYLWFDRHMHYLAVVLDLKTRQVTGWRLDTNHSSELTYAALLDALSKHPAPSILHSDQGSVYLSCTAALRQAGDSPELQQQRFPLAERAHGAAGLDAEVRAG